MLAGLSVRPSGRGWRPVRRWAVRGLAICPITAGDYHLRRQTASASPLSSSGNPAGSLIGTAGSAANTLTDKASGDLGIIPAPVTAAQSNKPANQDRDARRDHRPGIVESACEGQSNVERREGSSGQFCSGFGTRQG